jgi:hypothetical protein
LLHFIVISSQKHSFHNVLSAVFVQFSISKTKVDIMDIKVGQIGQPESAEPRRRASTAMLQADIRAE